MSIARLNTEPFGSKRSPEGEFLPFAKIGVAGVNCVTVD
jgi:hypothetical protein